MLALSAARGALAPMTTVRQPTSFRRAVPGSDVLIETVPHLTGTLGVRPITIRPE
ncbi:hypothetical protein ACIQGO_29010 [Streptomyces shenzhenensis]|uniref:hypothetical protein n=1 Tax=Streptomyces shenzhenensis TaxID=943815 RepID=UPI0037FBEA0F